MKITIRNKKPSEKTPNPEFFNQWYKFKTAKEEKKKHSKKKKFFCKTLYMF